MTSDFNFETGFGFFSVARYLPPLFHVPTLKIARDNVGNQYRKTLIGRTIRLASWRVICSARLLRRFSG